MFQQMTIRTKLLLGFGCMLLFLLILAAISYTNVSSLSTSFKNVGHTYEVIATANEALQELVNMETGLRGFVITGKDNFLEPFRHGLQKFDQLINKGKQLTNDNSSQVQRWGKLQQAQNEWVEKVAKSEISAREDVNKKIKPMDDLIATVEKGSGKTLMDGMRTLISELIGAEEGLLKIRSQETEDSVRFTKNSTIAIASFALLCGAFISIIITRKLLRQLGEDPSYLYEVTTRISSGEMDIKFKDHQGDGGVYGVLKRMVANLKQKIDEADNKANEANAEAEKARKASVAAEIATQKANEKTEDILRAAQQLESVVEVVTSASEQLSAQIEQSSRGAEEQAHRIGETATSMEEMNATVLEVAKSASSAASTAEQARAKAEEGAKLVQRVNDFIKDIGSNAHQSMGDMDKLGKQAEGIGQILNVISDIADQTNLLALNAAIEAARAGEAGRGFAVVADEVRKLAEKTMTATKEVGEAIRGIQNGTKKNIDNVERAGKAIEEVTKLANTSGESLHQIVSLAEATTDQVRSIATASEEQSSASEEINRSIEDVNRVSSETADAMRQSAQAVGELANQAQVLKRLIDEMKSDSGSSSPALPHGKKPLALGRAS